MTPKDLIEAFMDRHHKDVVKYIHLQNQNDALEQRISELESRIVGAHQEHENLKKSHAIEVEALEQDCVEWERLLNAEIDAHRATREEVTERADYWLDQYEQRVKDDQEEETAFRRRFKQLRDDLQVWERGNSTSSQMMPEYLIYEEVAIIALGENAISLILEEIDLDNATGRDSLPWWRILRWLSGGVENGSSDLPYLMRCNWIEWGRANGYLGYDGKAITNHQQKGQDK